MAIKDYLNTYQAYQNKYKTDLTSNLDRADVKQAIQYMRERGLDSQTLNKHEIGICIDNEQTNQMFLEAIDNTFSQEKIVDEIGLSSMNLDRQFLIDRITIPIKNDYGEIIGFCGRDFTGTKDPKYLYTKTATDNVALKKSSTLYNIENIGRVDNVYMVEGFFDVYALEKQGIDNVVGLMGVALSDNQIDLLKKHGVNTVTLSLDNDNAGIRATYEIGEFLQKRGFNVVVESIPTKDKDLDEYFKNNSDSCMEKLNHQTFDEFYCTNLDWNNSRTYYDNMEKLFSTLEPKTSEEVLLSISQQSGKNVFDIKSEYIDWAEYNNISLSEHKWVEPHKQQMLENRIEVQMKIGEREQFNNKVQDKDFKLYLEEHKDVLVDYFINDDNKEEYIQLVENIANEIGYNDELLDFNDVYYPVSNRLQQETINNQEFRELYDEQFYYHANAYIDSLEPSIESILKSYSVTSTEDYLDRKEFLINELNYSDHTYNDVGLPHREYLLLRLPEPEGVDLKSHLMELVEKKYDDVFSNIQQQMEINIELGPDL